ncbi:MAG: MoaD/ThiS family protein [Gammaproteobacteria bacterium]|nr:MoaD/ThiS family protein [Gammaproteobacteria bacterium]
MALIIFSSELQRLTGEEKVTVAASDYRELVDRLTQRYEQLERDDLMEMAVAIDGEIIHDPLLEAVGEHSEVHFLHKISGG